jgi:hypothetical protein
LDEAGLPHQAAEGNTRKLVTHSLRRAPRRSLRIFEFAVFFAVKLSPVLALNSWRLPRPPRFRRLDTPKRFHYGDAMAEYTLKNIPEEIYHRAQTAAESSLRSLNQEIIHRLRRSFDAEDARLSALHARWVLEALQSGPAKPLRLADLDAAFAQGVRRAKARRRTA